MAVKRHPEKLETQKQAPDNDTLADFVNAQIVDIRSACADRTSWELNLTRWFKKRYGVRPVSKSYPWPGASNTHIALVDEKIRKLKPNYVNLAFEGDPIVSMFPIGGTPIEVAQNAEIFMDWLLKYSMNQVPGKNYIESLTLCVDWMLEKGFSVGKVIWEHQVRSFTKVIDLEELPQDIQMLVFDPMTTDEQLAELLAQQASLDITDEKDIKTIRDFIQRIRDGKTKIQLELEEIVYSGPRLIAIDPKEIIVPNDTTDIEQARFIAHRMYMSKLELKSAERSGKYKNVDDILEHGASVSYPSATDYSTLTTVKSNREGVNQFLQRNNLYEVWEIFTYHDLDGDGFDEKVVVTVHPDTGTILRAIQYPYDHGKWPFVVFAFEMNDDRWYSPRGIPDLLDQYQTIVTNQENAKLDRMTLANSLQFKYRNGSINPSQMRFIPGQGIPVQRMDDLQEMQISNLDLSFDTEMNKIRGLAEQLIGQPDLSLSNLQNQQERRTALEVSETVSLGRQLFSLDARLFKNTLQKMYDQIFDLWLQYGPDEVWVTVTGGSQPIRLTRQQIQGNMVIVPNGEYTLLSRTMEQQRLFSVLQMALNDQSGALDLYNAWQEYMLKLDPRLAKRVLIPREQWEQQQVMKLQMQQQQQQAETLSKMAAGGHLPAQEGQPSQ
ncbi:portal protein [Caudoviricetes sp.]|nr:portal protein [Caudoviricetes sp.]UOF80992.1 portal protein [Caudoviricetes sp.]UOF81374.1 portal protein [Caudoviricetes sp.]